jgi:NAD(P)-dependent dehydrogenase (short-subunit alcohol dehydrogenase family)
LADQTAEAQGITREEAVAKTAAGVPIGRLGSDQEIAGVIVFLCSEPASYVAGAAWSVDGGIVQTIV